uniref:Uncharacterized protein n=1 Tax=Arundo donax TaxID=35708 RepID=A0A0A9BV66_ARUDO
MLNKGNTGETDAGKPDGVTRKCIGNNALQVRPSFNFSSQLILALPPAHN